MSTNQLAVGKEILSYCGKCKLPLNHIIVSMKDSVSVGKTKCTTCQAVHNYRDPKKVGKKKTSTTRRKKAADNLTLEETWSKAIKTAEGPSRPYSIKIKFAEGDVVEHPKFGSGYVSKTLDNNKIQILFEHSEKVLMHNMA